MQILQDIIVIVYVLLYNYYNTVINPHMDVVVTEIYVRNHCICVISVSQFLMLCNLSGHLHGRV